MQNNSNRLIIAIDGFSSSGKSTIAKALAKSLNLKYIDTGAMYRAITFKLVLNNIQFDDLVKIEEILTTTTIDFSISNGEIILDGKCIENKIRGLDVSNKVSEVSTIPIIRDFLVKIQRKLGISGGIVMDGRDIGTIVFPNAHLKFFIDANINVRANRRYEELISKGDTNIKLEDIKANLLKRDKIDSGREHSPLKIAPGSILINTEKLTKEEQLEFVIKEVQKYNNK